MKPNSSKSKELNRSEKFLLEINKLLYQQQSNKFDRKIQDKIEDYANKIISKRVAEKQKAKENSAHAVPKIRSACRNETIIEANESMDSNYSYPGRITLPPKPSYLRLLKQLFSNPDFIKYVTRTHQLLVAMRLPQRKGYHQM